MLCWPLAISSNVLNPIIWREKSLTKREKKTRKKLGELATNFVKKLAEGEKVFLKRDSVSDDRDKYGRLLRYVFLEDGRFLNEIILREGYASVYLRGEFSLKDEFKRLEKKARREKKGLWKEIKGLEQL